MEGLVKLYLERAENELVLAESLFKISNNSFLVSLACIWNKRFFFMLSSFALISSSFEHVYGAWQEIPGFINFELNSSSKAIQIRKFFIGKKCQVSNRWFVKKYALDMPQRRARQVRMYGMLRDKSAVRYAVFL